MRTLTLCIALLIIIMAPLPAAAQHGSRGMYKGAPYGHFCPGMGMGPYGVRRAIKTAAEAKKVIETYFSSLGQSVRIEKVEERQWYFEADVLDQDGATMDRVIVDRRTGRIRSIY
jgi:hypothetical protein